MPKWDYNLYPDTDAPDLDGGGVSVPEKADYLHRLCAQADFGVFPTGEQIEALAAWKEVFDACPLPDSPTYHALRVFFGWNQLPRTPYLPHQKVPWQLRDEREGREALVTI